MTAKIAISFSAATASQDADGAFEAQGALFADSGGVAGIAAGKNADSVSAQKSVSNG